MTEQRMRKIGITDYVQPPFEIEREALGEGWELVNLAIENPEDFNQARVAELDALLVWHAAISQEVADRLESCRMVVRYGVGYDLVDVDALERSNIIFCNTPDYGTEEVADTAAAMILQQVRRLPEYDYHCRHYASGWQEHTLAPLARTSQMTLGVIGVGRIGTALMRRMRNFGFRLLGFDPYLPSGHEKALGYERIQELDRLLELSDVVSIHCPATDETRGMVNADFFARMKPGSVFVNTARGTILESLDALEQALRSGQLRAAALDVLPQEPPGVHSLIDAWRNDAPWLRGRLVITPHTAYYSEAAWREMRFKAAETVRLFFDRGLVRNRISAQK